LELIAKGALPKAQKNVEKNGCNAIKRVSGFIPNKEGKAYKLNIKTVQAVPVAGIGKVC